MGFRSSATSMPNASEVTLQYCFVQPLTKEIIGPRFFENQNVIGESCKNLVPTMNVQDFKYIQEALFFNKMALLFIM